MRIMRCRSRLPRDLGPTCSRSRAVPGTEPASPGGDTRGTATVLRNRPQTQFTAETEVGFYRRKKSSVVVRHISGDGIVAILEIMSPGNKSSRHAFQAFLDKACELLEHRIHLADRRPLPRGPRDPKGVHGAIWEQVQDDPFHASPDQPLTLVAYECDLTTRAYIELLAVGQRLPDMPLFLEPNGCVMVPLEATFRRRLPSCPEGGESCSNPPSRNESHSGLSAAGAGSRPISVTNVLQIRCPTQSSIRPGSVLRGYNRLAGALHQVENDLERPVDLEHGRWRQLAESLDEADAVDRADLIGQRHARRRYPSLRRTNENLVVLGYVM